MSVSPIDTYEVVQELKAVGFTEAQAEMVTRVVRKSQEIELSNLATKVDLLAVATKADLLAFATKADLLTFATKADLLAFATKTDLLAFATKADLLALESKLQVGMAEMRTEILKWVIGSIGLQTVAIIGAVLALSRVMGH